MSFFKWIILLSIVGSSLLVWSCEESDTTPPEVTITSPQNNSIVSEIVSITCISTDNEGVDKVELWVNGISTDQFDESEPYSIDWNTTSYLNDPYTITVRSIDNNQNRTDSNPITLNVDNTNSNPQQVEINSILYEDGRFTITWDQSNEGDFGLYQLEKSFSSTMNTSEVIYSSDEYQSTSYVDIEINPLIYQYYRITVIDSFGYETTGPIFSSTLDPVPETIDIISIMYTLSDMTIEWEESSIGDFLDYKLLRSDSEDGSMDTIVTISEKSITTFSVSEFDPTTENWFWVIVSDTLGQSTLGNGYKVIDSPPSQIDISSIVSGDNQLIITWEPSTDHDFLRYELLRSVNNWGTFDLISTLNSSSDSTYTDVLDLTGNVRFYYQLRVVDHWEISSEGTSEYYSNYQKILLYRNDLRIVDIDGLGLRTISEDCSGMVWSVDGSKYYYSDYFLYEVTNFEGTESIRNTGIEISGINSSRDRTLLIGKNSSYLRENLIVEIGSGNVVWSDDGSDLIKNVIISPDNQFVIYNLLEEGSCRGDLIIEEISTGNSVNFGLSICHSPGSFYFNYLGDILYWNMGGNDNEQNVEIFKTDFNGLSTSGYELISVTPYTDRILGVSEMDNNLFIYTHEDGHVGLYDNNGNLIDDIFDGSEGFYRSISVSSDNGTILIPRFSSDQRTYTYNYDTGDVHSFLSLSYYRTEIQPRP
jgi:hypothetical protein